MDRSEAYARVRGGFVRRKGVWIDLKPTPVLEVSSYGERALI